MTDIKPSSTKATWLHSLAVDHDALMRRMREATGRFAPEMRLLTQAYSAVVSAQRTLQACEEPFTPDVWGTLCAAVEAVGRAEQALNERELAEEHKANAARERSYAGWG